MLVTPDRAFILNKKTAPVAVFLLREFLYISSFQVPMKDDDIITLS